MEKPLRRYFDLTIESDTYRELSLFGTTSGILITPKLKTIRGGKVMVKYINLWSGDFLLKIASTEENISYNILTQKGAEKLSDNLRYSTRLRLGFRPNEMFFRVFRDFFIRRLNRFGWNYTLKCFDELTAVCKYLSDESQKNIDRIAKVVPVPVDKNDVPSKMQDLGLKHPSAVLIQNHQIKQKSDALKSFYEVIEATPEITYYISRGLPENRNNIYYKGVIDKLTSLKNVQFVDIDSTNKYDYLYSTDLYILRSGLDCTPATILEAGISAKPVLASKVGGVPEMIIDGKTGWSIENDDYDLWNEKIITLTKNPGLASTMGSANRKHVLNNYEISIVAKKIYGLF